MRINKYCDHSTIIFKNLIKSMVIMATKIFKSLLVCLLALLLFSTFTRHELPRLYSHSAYPDVGKGYRLDTDPVGDVVLVNDQNTILVFGHLLDYGYNKDFIIASQRTRNSVKECTFEFETTLNACNAAFEKSTFVQYWIIDKRASAEKTARETEAARSPDADYQKPTNIHGPYTKSEYFEQRKLLGVPDSLILKI
jgi:hypothetical protein